MTRRRADSGYTLVEVLLALVICASVLVIAAQGFSIGATAASGASKLSRAVMLAEMVVAEYETGERSLTASGEGDFSPDWPEFSWASTIETTTIEGLSQLTVTVAWKEGTRDQTYSLVRLMAPREESP